MKRLLKILFTIFLIIGFTIILFNVKVKKIEIVGNTLQSDDAFIEQIFENDFEKTSIVVLIKDKFLKHKELPHVEKYTINWQTPFTIKIYVYEKEEIAFVKKNVLYAYFDKDGIVCDVNAVRKENIPEIRGLNFKSLVKGEKLELDDTNMLASILNISNTLKIYNMPFYLLEFDNSQGIVIYVGNIKVVLGDTKNMEVKLSRLKDIYPEIEDLNGTLDLSVAKENMLDEKYIFKKE